MNKNIKQHTFLHYDTQMNKRCSDTVVKLQNRKTNPLQVYNYIILEQNLNQLSAYKILVIHYFDVDLSAAYN